MYVVLEKTNRQVGDTVGPSVVVHLRTRSIKAARNARYELCKAGIPAYIQFWFNGGSKDVE